MEKVNPDHSSQLSKLNRVEGQISGIKKMINDRRYCPDIIQQIRAARKALFGIEAALLKSHLSECVSEAMKSKSRKLKDEKIEEVLKIFKSGSTQDIEL